MDEDRPLLSAAHERSILQVIVDRILTLEPHLCILERQTQFSKKKLTWTREERERAEAEAARLHAQQASSSPRHTLSKENQGTLEAFLDALYNALRGNVRTQRMFDEMEIVLLTREEADAREAQRVLDEQRGVSRDQTAGDNDATSPATPLKKSPLEKSRAIGGGYDLMVRLLQSDLTRRHAIRQLEALIEPELKLGPRFRATTDVAPLDSVASRPPSRPMMTRHASLSFASPPQLQSPPQQLSSPGGLGFAPSMYRPTMDRRTSSLSSPLGAPLGAPPGAPLGAPTTITSPAAQFAAITRARSVTGSPGHQHSLSAAPMSPITALSPPAAAFVSPAAAAAAASVAQPLLRGHGVNHYIQLLLDLLHELPANEFTARTLYLRSLRHVCSSSPYAQAFFRARSGFFNLFLLIDKLKVPELQRRKQLRKVATKVAGRTNDITAAESNETELTRSPEEERLANLMLFVRQLLLTLTSAYKQNAKSRLLWSRFGFDRLMDVIHESELLHFPHAMQLIVNWLVYMGLEHIPLGDRDCSPLAPQLNPPNALDPEAVEIWASTAGILYMPLAVCPALSLLPKTPISYQVRVIDHLYALARNDVANRAGLGKVGFLSVLLRTYRDVFLSTPEEREASSSSSSSIDAGSVLAHARDLRDPLMLFLRVLVAFTSSTIDVNALFGLLEEERWETIIAPLTDMVDHGNQAGRLWPYVHFDLSIIHAKSAGDTSCAQARAIDTRCADAY